MNRNEARELISKHSFKCENGKYVVPKKVAFIIVDCLENEDLLNKSCNNCKHYKQSSSQDYKTCYEIKVNGFNLESEKDFCCNKWEPK